MFLFTMIFSSLSSVFLSKVRSQWIWSLEIGSSMFKESSTLLHQSLVIELMDKYTKTSKKRCLNNPPVFFCTFAITVTYSSEHVCSHFVSVVYSFTELNYLYLVFVENRNAVCIKIRCFDIICLFLAFWCSLMIDTCIVHI